MGTKYSTVAVSGYNASPPPDDGSQTAANQVTWAKSKTKLGDPLKTAIEAVNSALVTALDVGSRQVTSADTTTAADHMKTVEIASTVSTSITVSLGDAATMAAGYIVTVKNSSANTQTVGRITAGDKINGVAANFALPSKGSLTFKVANTASEGYLIDGQSGAFFYDRLDPTKVVVLSASNVSSGATRLVLFPNSDLTVVGVATTQTLTNKTLDSPVIDTQVTGGAIADQASMETASSAVHIVTPNAVKWNPGVAKSWVQFNVAGTVAVSNNITSVTDNGTGTWTVNIATDFSSASYCGLAFGGLGAVASVYNLNAAKGAGTFNIVNYNPGGTLQDAVVNEIFAAFFGDQ